jgi:carbon-monoxide dehydrogenase large subunit
LSDSTDPSAGHRFVGQRVARSEDARFLTGHGRYVDDIVVPGVLHAAFARSNDARGRIVAVDTTAARALPGVVAVFTGADLNPRVLDYRVEQEVGHPAHRPFRLLADDDVRFVGEPVVLVVAESRYVAEDALELVEIDVEPEPAVVDYERALDPGTPVVHPGSASNAEELPAGDPSVLDDVLASAPVTLTETFRQHRYACVPMETRGTLASWDPFRQELTVWASTQGPFGIRGQYSRMLGIDASKVHVIMPDVGGAFGSKMWPAPEEMAVVLASHVLGRPVKWIEDRREHLLTAPHSREDQATVTMATDAEGHFLAARVDFVESAGAFPASGGQTLLFSNMLFPGPYRIARYAGTGRSVHTNTAGRGAYRGPWMIETVVREQMVDRVAARLGIDPLELRRRNVLHDDDMPYTLPTGMAYDQMTASATLEQAAEMVGYDEWRERQAAGRAEGRLVGIGISLLVEPSAMAFGPMSSEATTVRVNASGTVDVITSSISNGQSVETTLGQIVADELGVEFDQVRVLQGDTDISPLSGGSGGSRAAVIAGTSARDAAHLVRERVVAIAAQLLEASPDDLELDQGVVRVAGSPDRNVTLARVAETAYYTPDALPPGLGLGLEEHSRFRPDNFVTWSNACHICVVEVDRHTGRVEILRYVVSEDCGVMINPNVVEGQIAGGVVQGIGGVLYEHLPYDADGNPLATTFMDYLLPTAAEAPTIEYGHIETHAPTNPGGHKGIGEGGAIASPAAVANAVADALAHLGVEIRSQPLGPDNVFELLRAAGAA